MAVYVDRLIDYTGRTDWPKWRRKWWCHMTADSETELRAFGARLGLNPSWIEYPTDPARVHFNVQSSFRTKAIELGAIEITSRQMVQQRHKARAAGHRAPQTTNS